MKYAEATVRDMQRTLKDGGTSAADLLAEARRIITEKNPSVNAFIETFDSADEDACIADAMIAEGRTQPLTGIPVAVKDNICVKGHAATAASHILEGFISPYDAAVISRLREQGAVLVGRTNMDEFAMGSSTEHSVYGPTRNPHDITRVPGGSSGGSAAAVAMGAVPLALGSDTGGSIRQPAGFCGLVGLKPTYGSVSRHGLIALGSSLDVIGPLARTVDDAALLFQVIAGEGEAYDSTLDFYTDSGSCSGEKIVGVPDSLETIGVSAETMAAFNETLRSLKSCGYTVRTVSLPVMEHAGPIYYIIQPAEASSNLARFDGMRYGLHIDGDTLWADYINTRSAGFGDEVTRRIVVGTYVLSAGYYDAYYKKAMAARRAMRSAFLTALHEVPVLLLPTAPDTAFIAGEKQDPLAMYAEDRLTLQANLTGLPALSVPMRTDGLPRGVQCISGYGCEDILFACARDIQSM